MNKLLFLIALLYGSATALAQEVSVSEQTGIESEITIAVNPNNTDEIIIASMGTNSPILIYSSMDGGANWSQSSFGSGIADPVLTYGDNNTAYLTFLDFGNTLEMSLAQSTDNGQNWTISALPLDGMAADRQWIKRDNTPGSAYYENIYLAYFHPEGAVDIHLVKVDATGTIGDNHAVHSTSYDFVQNPAMDLTADGTIVIAFLAEENGNRKIVAVNSVDGGATFSTPTSVSNIYMYDNAGNPIVDVLGFAPGDASRLGNSLQMAIDQSTGPNAGRVYLTWTDFIENTPAEGMNVYLSYSDDNGTNWSTARIVNDDAVPSSHQYYSAIDVNADGKLCLSWYDRRTDPTNDAVTDFYFSLSTDGGENFAPSVKVSSMSSDHTAVTNGLVTFGVGEYTSLATTDTEAYLTWSDGRTNDGGMDVYFASLNLDDLTDVQEIGLYPQFVINDLYPNPVSNEEIKLVINSLYSGEIELSISNIQGTVVWKTTEFISATNDRQLFYITVADFPPGSYVLEIQHEKGVASRKFIVSR